MRALHSRCINVAIIGVNHEENYVSHEGDRTYRDRLRAGEALRTESRLAELDGVFDEVLILPFRASNEAPDYPFSWVNAPKTRRDYGAALTRIGSLYEQRFGQ